jgi:hypothetical protein
MIQRFFEFHSSDVELHYYALDWDDNILHMPTKILMDKKEGSNWVPVDVSTSEFAIVRNDKENYRLRNDDPKIAFSEFRDTGSRGNRAFIEDVEIAISKKAFAPSWPAFIKCLSEGALFAIITARGHEPESIRMGVEFVIDEILTNMPSENPGFSLADEMFQHLRKYHYMFGMDSYDTTQLKGVPSENELISNYLDKCGFYGVSSQSFANEFGEASASNPEKAKELALKYFIERCNEFGRNIGAKTVSVGFSDDDPKNVEHVEKFFKEHLPNMSGVKLSLYKTTDPSILGGEVKKFTETSNQAVGLESSTLSIRDNMTKRFYPNTPDAPTDAYHHQLKNQTNMVKDLTKDTVMKFEKKPRRAKKLRPKKNL